MDKEIHQFFNEILNDFYEGIQYMDSPLEEQQYSKYFKCKEWLNKSAIVEKE